MYKINTEIEQYIYIYIYLTIKMLVSISTSTFRYLILTTTEYRISWAASCEKGPDDTTRHVISSNLHLKSSVKNGGSNWVLMVAQNWAKYVVRGLFA